MNGPSFPALALVILASILPACRTRDLPSANSPEYAELVRAFNVGLAGLQSGEDIRAKSGLTRASQIAPGEPASFANLGILALRQQEFEAAWQNMDKARTLAPDNSRIEQYLGEIESRRGNLPEAIRHFRRAVELDPRNLKALYAMAEQAERQGGSTGESEALGLLKRLLDLQPSNSAVLLDIIRMAARSGDAATVKASISRLKQTSANWTPEAKQRLQQLEQASADLRQTAIQTAFLRNVLAREPAFRQDSNAVKTPAVFTGDPFVRFLRVPSPPPGPAEPDAQTAFRSQPLPAIPAGPVEWLRTVYLDDSGQPAILWADAAGVHVNASLVSPQPAGISPSVAAADLDYDFRTDLVVVSSAGLRIYLQEQPQQFTDRTPRSRLPASVIGGSYSAAWPFDVDLDGDLDLVLAAAPAPTVLRNNADGTYSALQPFPALGNAAAFVAADLDGDGDPDAAFIDAAGHLTAWINERLGQYRPTPLPPAASEAIRDIAAADLDANGQVDLLALKSGGTVLRISAQNDPSNWQVADVLNAQPDAHHLRIADFDNNGALDILAGSQVFLGSRGGFAPLASPLPITEPSVADMNADGRLDIVGLDASRNPALLANSGSKSYRWQIIRTRAANARGDQRINSFGLGGEIDVRAGLLAQKRTITSPVLHFGLGDHPQSDLARIIWPNGLVQVEFELQANQSILAAQRLKGSCPSLFSWDGSRMAFVKDGAPWSPALGLHINAQQVAGIYQTEEWFKIPGRHVAPRDGFYDLRVTAELWETYYIDHYSLLAVDHPPGTEIHTDERFAVPPPPLKIFATGASQPFLRALDDSGSDVGRTVQSADRVYLDNFGRGRYQGVTRDHWVELELPPGAPLSGSLYLIAEGWMHPTDATVNVALGQSSDPFPQGLRIDVPTENGQWKTVQSGLGFPAGKLKTIVLDISNVFQPRAPRKLRLGTNLEVFWDRLAWAPGLPASSIRTTNSPLDAAELRYRGFSAMRAANASSPEIPDYDTLEATGQKWRDLEGYYTRLGDIKPLLEKVDDRIVVVNAGDEMRLRFRALPPPPPGWQRDYVMIGDGWIKDGDYNSVFSKTVLPLPYHGLKDYTVPPGRLEEEVTYKKHPGDWAMFHTRYVAPDFFRGSLWNRN